MNNTTKTNSSYSILNTILKNNGDVTAQCSVCGTLCTSFHDRSCDRCHQHIDQNLSDFYTCNICASDDGSFDLCETCYNEDKTFIPEDNILSHNASHLMVIHSIGIRNTVKTAINDTLELNIDASVNRAYTCISCKNYACKDCVKATHPIKLKSYDCLFRRIICNNCFGAFGSYTPDTSIIPIAFEART